MPDDETHILKMSLDHYQAPARNLALKHCKKFDRALDVGAHIGLWSKHLCQKFNDVIAFEPVEAHRECIFENIDALNFSCEPYAIGASNGTIGMHIAKDCSGGSHVEPGTGVNVRALDDIDFDTVDFIKMDVEGYELFALKGAVETLEKHKPVVVIEQKKNIHFGLPQYAASDFLKSLGAKEIGRAVDDWVFAW